MQSDLPVESGRLYLDGLLTRMCLAVPPNLTHGLQSRTVC